MLCRKLAGERAGPLVAGSAWWPFAANRPKVSSAGLATQPSRVSGRTHRLSPAGAMQVSFPTTTSTMPPSLKSVAQHALEREAASEGLAAVVAG